MTQADIDSLGWDAWVMEATKAEWVLNTLRGIPVDMLAVMGLDPQTGQIREEKVKKHRRPGEAGHRDPSQFAALQGEVDKAASEALRTPHEIPDDQWDSIIMPHMMGPDTPPAPTEEPEPNKRIQARDERNRKLSSRNSILRRPLD